MDQQICDPLPASDESSGVASNSCADVVGPAYLYTLGANTIMATATDQAGNSGMGSVSFTVAVTPASIGNLGLQFVRSSTTYQRLPAKQQALIDKLAGAERLR